MRHRLSFCPLLAPPRQGEFLGQTKKKVDDLMASAPGGMVFIDEAYNLGGRSLYAKEAVDQLTFCMTDKPYKGKSVVVLARTRPARPFIYGHQPRALGNRPCCPFRVSVPHPFLNA